jgi:hypothetical protein
MDFKKELISRIAEINIFILILLVSNNFGNEHKSYKFCSLKETTHKIG